MMKLLIIQTGDAATCARVFGNFDEWFKLAAPEKLTDTVHVHQGQTLPDISLAKAHYSHIIVTGSAAMITEHLPWMTATQNWLSQCIEDVPTLGVCFGHQLLVDMLGGQVDYNPKGRNMGRDLCELNSAGMVDPLFANSSKPSFVTWVSHLQSVIQMPKSCQILARCEKDENHAFRYQKHVYGVQFHPEWNSQIMAAYIKERKQVLSEAGYNIEQMYSASAGSIEGSHVIRQFIRHI